MAKRQKKIMIDTNIIIRFMEGNPFIINELYEVIGIENISISIISIGEIYYGMRRKEEKFTKNFINQCNKLLIDKEICNKFIELQLGYRNDRIAIADCFIAAISLCNNIELYTLNTNDFNYIRGLKLYKPSHEKII